MNQFIKFLVETFDFSTIRKYANINESDDEDESAEVLSFDEALSVFDASLLDDPQPVSIIAAASVEHMIRDKILFFIVYSFAFLN